VAGSFISVTQDATNAMGCIQVQTTAVPRGAAFLKITFITLERQAGNVKV